MGIVMQQFLDVLFKFLDTRVHSDMRYHPRIVGDVAMLSLLMSSVRSAIFSLVAVLLIVTYTSFFPSPG